MYVYMYIYIYICMYVCIYIYIYVYTHILSIRLISIVVWEHIPYHRSIMDSHILDLHRPCIMPYTCIYKS